MTKCNHCEIEREDLKFSEKYGSFFVVPNAGIKLDINMII